MEYLGLGIACSGKFIMSYTKDGCITLREPKGPILKKIFTSLKETVEGKVSPCGRFIVVVGLIDVEIYEVQFNAVSGNVEDVPLKWSIKTKIASKLTSAAFSTDSSKLVLLANDGSWLLYDTTGKKILREISRHIIVNICRHSTLLHLLMLICFWNHIIGSRVNMETQGRMDEKTDGLSKPAVSLSCDGRVVGVCANRSLFIFSAFSGDQLAKISDIYKGIKLSSSVFKFAVGIWNAVVLYAL